MTNYVFYNVYLFAFILLQAKELVREAYIDDVFYQTHLRKGSGRFVDERSRRTHVSKNLYYKFL